MLSYRRQGTLTGSPIATGCVTPKLRIRSLSIRKTSKLTDIQIDMRNRRHITSLVEYALMLTVAALMTVTFTATLIVFLGGDLGTVARFAMSLLP